MNIPSQPEDMAPSALNVPNAYTDGPKLHPNLIIASLQMLSWLYFHPSAWRNHINHIASDLSPDFTLAGLRGGRWREAAICRVLIIGYISFPLLVGLMVSIILLVAGEPANNIILGAAGGMIYTLMLAVIGSILAGVALALAASVSIGIVAGVAVVIAANLADSTVVRAVVTVTLIGLIFGLIGGRASILPGHLITRKRHHHSVARQLGAVIVGVVIGGVTFLISSLIIFTGDNLASEATNSLLVGLVSGLATGLVVGWCRTIRLGLIVGLMYGTIIAVVFNFALSQKSAVALNIAFGTLFVAFMILPYLLSERVTGPLAGALASALGTGGGFITFILFVNGIPLWPGLLISLGGLLLGLIWGWAGPMTLYPVMAVWSILLLRLDEWRSDRQPSLLRWNPAFWDEYQQLPLPGLEEHLILVAGRSPAEAKMAIDHLSTSSQRWAAQRAQIELDARELENCEDVNAIGQIYRQLHAGELIGPASALLRSFGRLSQDITAALQQESAFNRRLALSAVEDRLDGLVRELTRSNEPYAVRFQPVATSWRQIVAKHRQILAMTVELRQEIDSPYIIGVPLTEQQEIFVGRTDITARIEQLLLDRRRPPLLLYGQRRMGKTSLLNNLGRLLPSTIVPLFVDLQGPASRASNHAGFLYNVARGMAESARRQRNLTLPRPSREALADDPFTEFDEWLDEVEEILGQATALLALDEFEALEGPIAKGQFEPEVLLGSLRHLIQHRLRFKVLLTGSHAIDELQRWASYLINVQTIHISYLNEAEARQLIEQPVKDFALRYEPAASRRVLELSRGHPFMVQLLCGEIVALKNQQAPAVRRLARLGDVEAAVPEALARGSFFFADIGRNQLDPSALALLRFLAGQGEGAVLSRVSLAKHFAKQVDHSLLLLARRELIETTEQGYRVQVELIRRWFAQE